MTLGSSTTIAVGSYTGGGTTPGISIFERPASSTPLTSAPWKLKQAVAAVDPSYLAGGDPLVAVSETSTGALTSFARTGDGYRQVGQLDALGAGPCHVNLLTDGITVVVTSYDAGSVFAANVDRDGRLSGGRTLTLPPGTGPISARQDRPHAHQSIETRWGTVIVADLGGDRLLEVELGSPELRIARVIALPPGSGPRHMTWFDGNLLVVGELDSRIYSLELSQSDAAVVGSTPTCSDALLPGHANATSQPSHVATSASGRHVIVLNRGRDTVGILSPKDGELQLDRETPTGGSWPRHFLELGESLLIANQHSDTVTELAIVNDFERLTLNDNTIQIGSPACILEPMMSAGVGTGPALSPGRTRRSPRG